MTLCALGEPVEDLDELAVGDSLPHADGLRLLVRVEDEDHRRPRAGAALAPRGRRCRRFAGPRRSPRLGEAEAPAPARRSTARSGFGRGRVAAAPPPSAACALAGAATLPAAGGCARTRSSARASGSAAARACGRSACRSRSARPSSAARRVLEAFRAGTEAPPRAGGGRRRGGRGPRRPSPSCPGIKRWPGLFTPMIVVVGDDVLHRDRLQAHLLDASP